MNRCPLDGELCERAKPYFEWYDDPWGKYRRYRVKYKNATCEHISQNGYGMSELKNSYLQYEKEYAVLLDWVDYQVRCENIEMLYALSGGPLPGNIGTKEMIEMAELLVEALRGTNQ